MVKREKRRKVFLKILSTWVLVYSCITICMPTVLAEKVNKPAFIQAAQKVKETAEPVKESSDKKEDGKIPALILAERSSKKTEEVQTAKKEDGIPAFVKAEMKSRGEEKALVKTKVASSIPALVSAVFYEAGISVASASNKLFEEPVNSNLDMGWYVNLKQSPSSTKINSLYGFEQDYYQKYRVEAGISNPYHWGIDVQAGFDTEIVSCFDGSVTQAGGDAYNTLVIQNDDGWEVKYLHLSDIKVSVGQRVSKGEFVAYAGNAGPKYYDPHLHVSLITPKGNNVDPLFWCEVSDGYEHDVYPFYSDTQRAQNFLAKDYNYVGPRKYDMAQAMSNQENPEGDELLAQPVPELNDWDTTTPYIDLPQEQKDVWVARLQSNSNSDWGTINQGGALEYYKRDNYEVTARMIAHEIRITEEQKNDPATLEAIKFMALAIKARSGDGMAYEAIKARKQFYSETVDAGNRFNSTPPTFIKDIVKGVWEGSIKVPTYKPGTIYWASETDTHIWVDKEPVEGIITSGEEWLVFYRDRDGTLNEEQIKAANEKAAICKPLASGWAFSSDVVQDGFKKGDKVFKSKPTPDYYSQYTK